MFRRSRSEGNKRKSSAEECVSVNKESKEQIMETTGVINHR